MLKSRGFITVLVLLVLIGVIYIAFNRRTGTIDILGTEQGGLPVYIINVIPKDWKVVPGLAKECDFNADNEPEWFVVYRYDTTEVPAAGQAAAVKIERGPVGAAIFDRQNTTLSEGSGNPSPYRPTLVVPYRLLPDFYADKGQGYLGETGASSTSAVKTIFHPVKTSTGKCQADEITILGYADSVLPTRLSIFRWQGPATGFAAAHFAGNARIKADVPPDGSRLVEEVITYNRLENHRSLLCEKRSHQRNGTSLTFKEVPEAFTVDFCFGPPADPYYPEGVVVALLRGEKPRARTAPAGATPTGSNPFQPTNSYLLNSTLPTAGAVPAAGQAVQIFSVTNPGGVSTDPAGGRECTAAEVTPGAGQKWICGRESAVVETTLWLDEQMRRATWHLISVVPDQVDSDVHWRVARVDLP